MDCNAQKHRHNKDKKNEKEEKEQKKKQKTSSGDDKCCLKKKSNKISSKPIENCDNNNGDNSVVSSINVSNEKNCNVLCNIKELNKQVFTKIMN
ncbi:hypothetical protein RFI_38911 [Reticulomyxa filosa]|uniref:Uncharacterized protein n=1 Tax=Reticulomyxa filosa TaxID=46433 RepID=X6LBR4_RETFI|nr:hypothetical protein RFI_38911 [Reticulomyxa filosa]|eukprot:ETN98581.1 hypothetical protein RFI_38911 [Reticulomyxa filosa]